MIVKLVLAVVAFVVMLTTRSYAEEAHKAHGVVPSSTPEAVATLAPTDKTAPKPEDDTDDGKSTINKDHSHHNH